MQVSNVQDHCTHAVIGGKPTIEFGISSSAEFFNILSSTLYSNQPLAVVREVLCNAWDAHIAAGRTDKPVEVGLTSNLFRVRDFGKGIPHDSIGEIYGTYGNSTKANDGQQTGGFGLGCKAPFAYVDHFEVTSTNQGTRTIYTMSKSSAKAMGKPGITPITSFPSQDSGLQVSLAIQPNDFNTFKSYVAYLAYMGDMKVSFNGEVLPTLNMLEDFAYVRFRGTPAGTLYRSSHILIRYGNVVYPLPDDDAWKKDVRDIVAFLHNNLIEGGQLILQAPPHSISVTPSRESLSLQEHTKASVKQLLTEFLEKIEQVKNRKSQKLRELVDRTIQEGNIPMLLRSEMGFNWMLQGVPTTTRTLSEMVTVGTMNKYPDQYIKEDRIYRVKQLAKMGYLDPGLSYSFLKAYKNTPGSDMRAWVMKAHLSRLMNRMEAFGDHSLKAKNLMVFYNENAYYRSREALPLKKWGDTDASKVISLLKKVVVISHAAGHVLAGRVMRCPELTAEKNIQQFLVYHTERKPSQVQPAIDFFLSQGFTVLDFTQEYSWDLPKMEKKASSRKSKTDKWYPLTTLADGRNSIDVQAPYGQASTYKVGIQGIEYYLDLTSQGNLYRRIVDLGSIASRKVVDLFGGRGVVAKFKYELDPLKKLGLPSLDTWLLDKVLEYVSNNPRITKHFAHCEKKFSEANYTSERLFFQIVSSEKLSKLFGINRVELNTEEQAYYTILLSMFDSMVFKAEPEIAALASQYAKTNLAPEYKELYGKLKKTPMLQYMDTIKISYTLDNDKSPEYQVVTKLLDQIINNKP